MATYTPDPRAYELMVLLSPELDDEALDGEMQRISNALDQANAEITSTKSTTPWGRRRLAYPIERHQDAFYVLYTVTSQPGTLEPLERDLKFNSNVLRYLLVRQEKTELEPEETEGVVDEEPVAETDANEGQAEGNAVEIGGAASTEVSESAEEPEEETVATEAADDGDDDRT